jgi:D-3-phosphoglycerate dehydrogenase
MPERVLITDGVFGGFDLERSILEPLGMTVDEASATDEPTLAAEARGAAGILVCYAQLTRPVIEAAGAGGCKVVARYGIGVDNVDLDAATEAGIVVTNVPDYCLDEVADHTMALLLAHARGVSDGTSSVRSGGWELANRDLRRLGGRRLAVLGVGGIGRRVAVRAQAFGLEVVGFDPFVDPWDVPDVRRAQSIAEAVRDAHYVSVHVPLTAANRHLIGTEVLAEMRQAPLLINTARGGLVDLEAAQAALDDGTLSGVALDVVDPEPLPEDHPLRTHPRAIITPHIAFHSVEATEELRTRTAGEVARVLRGRSPQSPVNKVGGTE